MTKRACLDTNDGAEVVASGMIMNYKDEEVVRVAWVTVDQQRFCLDTIALK